MFSGFRGPQERHQQFHNFPDCAYAKSQEDIPNSVKSPVLPTWTEVHVYWVHVGFDGGPKP